MTDADQRRPISAAQWQAGRAIFEGSPPTGIRVAATLGCSEAAFYARAKSEGWRSADYRRMPVRQAHAYFIDVAFGGRDGEKPGAEEGEAPGLDWADRDAAELQAQKLADCHDDPATMLARGARFMARRLALLIREADRSGQINRKEIDGLVALARMMERWETLAKERATMEEAKSDAELAETLRIVNQKIVELAHGEALRLVAAGELDEYFRETRG